MIYGHHRPVRQCWFYDGSCAIFSVHVLVIVPAVGHGEHLSATQYAPRHVDKKPSVLELNWKLWLIVLRIGRIAEFKWHWYIGLQIQRGGCVCLSYKLWYNYTDDLRSHPYDISSDAISYGWLTNSSVSTFAKNPFKITSSAWIFCRFFVSLKWYFGYQ